MSSEERGENLRFEGFVFPSFDDVTGTGYQLHPPPYSKEEQFSLLENRVLGASLWEAMTLYCDAKRDRLGDIFTINQNEYLQWARKTPIAHFVNTKHDGSDGHFLVKKDKGWELIFQERGTINQMRGFDSFDEVKEYLIRNFSPYNIFEQLKKPEDASELCSSENEPRNHTWSPSD